MGKSNKKSATKVEAPAVVVPAPKSGKKGKRGAGNEIEKVVSAKKQKVNEGVAQAIQKKKVEAKTQKKKAETSSSEEESDVSSDSDVKAPKSKVAAQNGLAAAIKKKEVSTESSDESSDESEDDDETPAKVTGQKPAAAKKGPSVAVKKANTSSSGSEDEGTTKDEDSIDSPDSDEDMEDTGSDGSEEEVSSDKEEDDEQPKTPKTAVTTSKTLFVGNLNFRIEEHDVKNFFKDAGEVVDVRFASDPEGKFKGFGHVEFATAEEAKKALEFNGLELLGRDVRLDLARERGEKGAYTPTGSESNSHQKGPRGASKTIFIRGFDSTLGEDEIRSSLQEVFSSCGEITRVSIPKDYETGASKGMAYMDFTDADSFTKALGLDGSEFGDSYLKVEEAKPKGDFGTPRSNDRGRGRGRFSRGGDRGRGFRGRRGGRDGGRGGRDGGRGRGRGRKYT
ncbi:unnamed protein product [Malus baccata var. baccata]